MYCLSILPHPANSHTVLLSIFAILGVAAPSTPLKRLDITPAGQHVNVTNSSNFDANGNNTNFDANTVLRLPIRAHLENRCPFSVWVISTVRESCKPPGGSPNTPMMEIKPRHGVWVRTTSYHSTTATLLINTCLDPPLLFCQQLSSLPQALSHTTHNLELQHLPS
jgi:hypothetical protein